MRMTLPDYLHALGLRPGLHVLLHCSLRKIRSAFPASNAEALIAALQSLLTADGSLIMPAFSYCFKKTTGDSTPFRPADTPGDTGYVSERFRRSAGVRRTAAPTHSFALWGKITEEVEADNSPTCPLGEGSVLAWLHAKSDSAIALLGVDFSALTFGHYLESKAKLPWLAVFPWAHEGILPIAVSARGEQPLQEVPGCSRSFINLEYHLLAQRRLMPLQHAGLRSYLIPVARLYEEGLEFLREHPAGLLCAPGTCPACDARRKACHVS